MNLGCRRVLITYIVVMALMLLFPPMLEVPSHGSTLKIVSAGFYFIGRIGGGEYTGILGVNLPQLCLQVVMVSLMAAAGYLIFKDRRN